MTEAPQVIKSPFKDPKPTVERISQLAARVLTGDILLPRFQRDFVWPREKILGLLDSIGRNYPIGSILLWQSRNELASERSIAGLAIADAKPDYPVNYLLDGQQRISSLCGALYWRPSDDPMSMWNIIYDLREQSFSHLHSLDDPPLSQVPLRYFSDPATFFKRTTALDDAELRKRAEALFNRFQDYMIAAVTLGDMPMTDIAPIFERINSTATPLTIVDLMRAATWDPEFDLRDAIDGTLAQLSNRDFQQIDRKTLLRAVSACAGYGFSVDDMDKLRNRSVEDLKSIVNEVTGAAKRAVDFLVTHICTPRPQALPYVNQFAVLCEIFRRIPNPDSVKFGVIERWFWRTTLSGYFGGWNTGQMNQDFKAIAAFASGKEPDIPVLAALPRDDIWKVTQFRANSATSKMLALMLSYQNPVDLLTGHRIDARRSLAWSNDKEFHHFFPQAYLKEQKVPGGRINAAANIVLLSSASNIRISSSPPSKYLGQLLKEVGEEETLRRLATLLVSEDAFLAALEDDYVGFLTARSATLQATALGLAGESEGAAVGEPTAMAGEAFVDDQVDTDVSEDESLNTE